MIDQRRCKYVQTISECKSISKAAQQLYISQPSLSCFVKKLEEELGVKLFNRKKIPLELTAAGKQYMRYIKEFQALENKMNDEFSQMGINPASQMTIATLPFLGTYVLPKIIPKFANMYPSVDLNIQECGSKALIESLFDGKADLCLTNIPPVAENVNWVNLGTDRVIIAAPRTKQLEQRYDLTQNSPKKPLKIDLTELQNETFIVLHPWQNMRVVAEAICAHFHITPRERLEVSSLAIALSLVGCNRGITFVCQSSLSCIRPEVPMVYFSVGDMESYTSIIAVYKKDDNSLLIRRFCDCAIQVLKRSSEN